jgi:hypothetical protein
MSRSNPMKNPDLPFFSYSVKPSLDSSPKAWICFTIPSPGLEPQLRESVKSILGEVAIYPCIDIPYGLNEHTRVGDVLEFNPTKGLGERHDFSQSNRGLKP